MEYYFTKKLNLSFEDAVQRAIDELGKQDFGVITEIDVKATLKQKLGVDFRAYKILGACNPNYAHQALLKEDKIGAMLPCNVIVQEHSPGEVEVSAVDPAASMSTVDNPALGGIAVTVREKLKNVIANL